MLEASSGYGGPGGYGQPPGGYGPPGQPPGQPPGGYPPPGAPPGGYGAPPGQPPGGYGAGGGFTPPPAPGGYPGPGAPGGGPPGAWSATEALGYAWSAITKDFANVALPLIAGFFVMGIPSGIVSGIRGGIVGAMASSGSVDMSTIQIINFGSIPIILLINALAQGFMLGGIMSFAIKAARGQKPQFGEIFQGGRFFGPMMVASLLQILGVYFGTFLCIVPGVLLALGWMLYPIMVVERGAGGVDALKQSWQMTTGQKMNLFILALLLFVATIVGLLACCVGALVVGPLWALSIAFVYMRLTGEEPRPFGAG